MGDSTLVQRCIINSYLEFCVHCFIVRRKGITKVELWSRWLPCLFCVLPPVAFAHQLSLVRLKTHTCTHLHKHTRSSSHQTQRAASTVAAAAIKGYFMTGFLLHLPHLRLSACHILLYRCIFHFSQLSSAPASTLTTPKARVLLNARDPIALYQSWGRARILHLPHSRWIAQLLSTHPQTANSSRHLASTAFARARSHSL